LRIFSEEKSSEIKKTEVFLILKNQEARALIEALEAAIKSRPRKKKWKKLLTDLEERALIY